MKPGDWVSIWLGHGKRRRRSGFMYMGESGHVHYCPWTEKDATTTLLAEMENNLGRLRKVNEAYDQKFGSRPWRFEGLESFLDDAITKSYKPPGMTHEERFGRS